MEELRTGLTPLTIVDAPQRTFHTSASFGKMSPAIFCFSVHNRLERWLPKSDAFVNYGEWRRDGIGKPFCRHTGSHIEWEVGMPESRVW
jgi:hypothetical protein